VLVPLATIAPLTAGAAAAPGQGAPAQDRAATRAYLEAELTYAQALLAAAPVSKEREEALARQVSTECPGAIASAPFMELLPPAQPPERVPTSRQRGEQRRLQRQWEDLRLELGFTLAEPPTNALRQAGLAYARKVETLRWTDRGLTTRQHQDAEELERELLITPPNLCADMRVWAASGYQRISAGTQAFEREFNAVLRPSLEALQGESGRSAYRSESPLRYAGPREKALARELARLKRERAPSLKRSAAVSGRIERSLGIPEVHEPSLHMGPPQGAMVIGHGKTAAGPSYTIWVAPKGSAAAKGFACRSVVGIELTRKGSRGSGEKCLSRSRAEPPTVECDEGLLTVEAQTSPRARRARLTLSDGRHVVSRVAVVPARLGGPIGVYYQAVWGPKPIPTSLTELDARGRALRTVPLEPQKRCVKGKPSFVVGPTRTIARGSVPQGPTFAIIGERSGEEGAEQLQLRVDVEGEPTEGSSVLIAFPARVGASVSTRPSTFAVQTSTGCRPHEYAILYGVLRDPKDTVWARSGGQLTQLSEARVPAILHAHGVLAYAGLEGVPSEVLVRSPGGKTLSVEKLDGRAQESKETCEGEAEPSA
jgi:hypothetical protein